MLIIKIKQTKVKRKMGLYDTIHVFQRCPYCKRYQAFDAQTKDLGRMMFYYSALSDTWFKKNQFGKDLREKLSASQSFPFDKSHKVWKSQAERVEARAKVTDEFKKSKFINVIVDCHSQDCQVWADKRDIIYQGSPSGFGRHFEGKIKIKKGMLFGDIYDIDLINKNLPKKRKTKRKLKIMSRLP